MLTLGFFCLPGDPVRLVDGANYKVISCWYAITSTFYVVEDEQGNEFLVDHTAFYPVISADRSARRYFFHFHPGALCVNGTILVKVLAAGVSETATVYCIAPAEGGTPYFVAENQLLAVTDRSLPETLRPFSDAFPELHSTLAVYRGPEAAPEPLALQSADTSE